MSKSTVKTILLNKDQNDRNRHCFIIIITDIPKALI